MVPRRSDTMACVMGMQVGSHQPWEVHKELCIQRQETERNSEHQPSPERCKVISSTPTCQNHPGESEISVLRVWRSFLGTEKQKKEVKSHFPACRSSCNGPNWGQGETSTSSAQRVLMDCHIGGDSWFTESSYDLQLSETAVLATVFEGTQCYGGGSSSRCLGRTRPLNKFVRTGVKKSKLTL